MAKDIVKQYEDGIPVVTDHLNALLALTEFPAGGTEDEIGPVIDRIKETENAVISLELSVPSDIFHAIRAEAAERSRKQRRPQQ